eukprot:scaffold73494_cov35-Tisochrysis_lutea.AAC.2
MPLRIPSMRVPSGLSLTCPPGLPAHCDVGHAGSYSGETSRARHLHGRKDGQICARNAAHFGTTAPSTLLMWTRCRRSHHAPSFHTPSSVQDPNCASWCARFDPHRSPAPELRRRARFHHLSLLPPRKLVQVAAVDSE